MKYVSQKLLTHFDSILCEQLLLKTVIKYLNLIYRDSMAVDFTDKYYSVQA